MTRILSLDGGGIRGIITAEWLGELQRHLDRPLVEYFDLICGTSTGSILAAGLASGRNPEELSELYQKHADRIFPYGIPWWKDRVKRVFTQGLSAPLYSTEGIDEVLKEIFGDIDIQDLEVRTVIPTYSASTGHPVVFDSGVTDERFPLWKIVRASTAAPIFFPAVIMNVAEEEHILMDGGLSFNNPSLLGASLLERSGCSQRGIQIFSFGTGEAPPVKSVNLAQNGGIVEWGFGLKLVPVAMDAALDAVDVVAKRFYPYYRVQVKISAERYSIDNARPANLQGLRDEARHNFDQIAILAGILKEEKA